MKSKALWLGLLAVGVADWLLLNVVVGPAYLASTEAPSTAPAEPAAAVLAALPPLAPSPKPEATGDPPVEAAAGNPPVPDGPVSPPSEAEQPPVPSEPEPSETPATKTVALASAPPTEPVLFTRQSAEIRQEARRSLKQLGKYMLDHPEATILIEGHADRRGRDEFNDWLSLQRARAVRAYLQGLGVPPSRMTLEARGSSRPVDESGTQDARAKNRRVELTLK